MGFCDLWKPQTLDAEMPQNRAYFAKFSRGGALAPPTPPPPGGLSRPPGPPRGAGGEPPTLLPAKIIKETLSKTCLFNLESLEPSWKDRILKSSASPKSYISLLKLQAKELLFNPGKVVALRRLVQGLLKWLHPPVTKVRLRACMLHEGTSSYLSPRRTDPVSLCALAARSGIYS